MRHREQLLQEATVALVPPDVVHAWLIRTGPGPAQRRFLANLRVAVTGEVHVYEDVLRHQARTAALIMWRTGLRVSEVLELEWRDLDYSGDPATLLVRKLKSRRARTVRLHPDLVQLFTNWPANRSPRDKLVPLSTRTALRHIGDGIEWAGLGEESPGTGQRRAGAHSLRHSAARHWLVAGGVPLNVVSSWLGHANVQVTLRIYLPIVGSDYTMDASRSAFVEKRPSGASGRVYGVR